MAISIRNIADNNIPLSVSSPSNTITSHILIQTEAGRLSDTSIRYNRIHDDFFNDYSYNYVQRCSIRPVMWILLLLLVAFSVAAIVMGEAISDAFPLDLKERKAKLFMRGNDTIFHESALLLDVGDEDDVDEAVLVKRNDTWDDDDMFTYSEESHQEIEMTGGDEIIAVLEHDINKSIAENILLNLDQFNSTSDRATNVSISLDYSNQPLKFSRVTPANNETNNTAEAEITDPPFR